MSAVTRRDGANAYQAYLKKFVSLLRRIIVSAIKANGTKSLFRYDYQCDCWMAWGDEQMKTLPENLISLPASTKSLKKATAAT
jgi:hypothetical protein